MNAEETIIYLIELYHQYLDELNAAPRNDFTIGKMTAYVKTLEILQRRKKAAIYGLDFVIEVNIKFRLLLRHANVTPTEFLSVGYFLYLRLSDNGFYRRNHYARRRTGD